MAPQSTAILATSLLAGLFGHPAHAQTYSFKTIDINRNDDTLLFDINRSNTILGEDAPTSGNVVCTLIKGPTKTVINDPAGVATNCYGLNSSGTIVGYYNKADNSAVGFTYKNGVYTDFIPPGGMLGVIPLGISDSGSLTGYYYDASGAHGFVLKGTNYKTFQIAGMSNVFPIGINNNGQITIQTIDGSGKLHAFFKHGAALTELVYPGATLTVIERLNNKGQAAGGYRDAANVPHGFVFDSAKSAYYTVDFPGAAATGLGGINDNQTLVGQYRVTATSLRQGLKATGSLP